jgi:hypothetical protein
MCDRLSILGLHHPFSSLLEQRLHGRKGRSKIPETTGHQWPSTVNVATWEAAIRWIAMQGEPRQYFSRPHIQNNQIAKLDWSCGSIGRLYILQVRSSNP